MFANQQAQAKVEDKRKRIIAGAAARRNALEAESQGRFADSMNRTTRTQREDDMAGAEEERIAEDVPLVTAPAATAVPEGSAPKEVGATNARALRQATNKSLSLAKRRAAVGAYGDAQGEASANLATNNNWQSMFGNFAQGDARVLPAQLETANSAGGMWRGLGGLLSAGGGAVGGIGASGGGPSWGDIGSWFSGPAVYGRAQLGTAARGPWGTLVGGV